VSLPPELQSALLGRRVVFLRGRLDDATANGVIAQLLLVALSAAGRTIELYVDSPGGSLSAALSVYDVMQTSAVPVSTTCVGTAGGASVLVLAGGASGLRFATPHARVHLAEEQVDITLGGPTEVGHQADEATRLHTGWQAALARHVAQSAAQLARDLASGQWLSAAEARDYGLVDGIVASAVPSAGRGT
jgi:ATP-dependent Clp protease protease subunit